MYLKVLQEAFKGKYTDEEEAEVLDLFRRLVGSIVTLFDTLSVCDLGPFILGPVDDPVHVLTEVLSPASFDSGPSGKLQRGTSRSVETSALVTSIFP